MFDIVLQAGSEGLEPDLMQLMPETQGFHKLLSLCKLASAALKASGFVGVEHQTEPHMIVNMQCHNLSRD